MKTIKKHLQETYHLSNYQIAQLIFLFKTTISELSKIIIMGILFYNRLGSYVFALFVMLFLRCSTGGLHFYTYIGCLSTSIIYIWLAVLVFPSISLPAFIRLLLLLACIVSCYIVGPVVSKYRPEPSTRLFVRGRNTTCLFIFVYALVQYIIPDTPILRVGLWVIILHSLQLAIAKIRKKGECIKWFPIFLSH